MQVAYNSGPKIRSEPSPACFICGLGGEMLYEGLRDYLAGTQGEWNIRKCVNQNCSLLWLDPEPLEADMRKAYEGYHTHTASRSHNLTELWFSILNLICKLISRTIGLISGLGAQRRKLKRMYIGTEKPGKLLEVGCGGGRFLNRMRKAGWAVEGVEFDPKATARVRERFGINIRTGNLADMHYPDEIFDVVTMSQVIEHIHDPIALLCECWRVLRSGGRLIITTPNALSLAHRNYGRYWRGLEPPRHIHIFSPAALKKCAQISGFGEIQVGTSSAESTGIYRTSDEIKEMEDSEQRKKSTSIRILKSWLMQHYEFYKSKENPELGQDIVLIAKKLDKT
jgi:SAM-dependent methyltransferase